jgi:hypothetical protein
LSRSGYTSGPQSRPCPTLSRHRHYIPVRLRLRHWVLFVSSHRTTSTKDHSSWIYSLVIPRTRRLRGSDDRCMAPPPSHIIIVHLGIFPQALIWKRQSRRSSDIIVGSVRISDGKNRRKEHRSSGTEAPLLGSAATRPIDVPLNRSRSCQSHRIASFRRSAFARATRIRTTKSPLSRF